MFRKNAKSATIILEKLPKSAEHSIFGEMLKTVMTEQSIFFIKMAKSAEQSIFGTFLKVFKIKFVKACSVLTKEQGIL